MTKKYVEVLLIFLILLALVLLLWTFAGSVRNMMLALLVLSCEYRALNLGGHKRSVQNERSKEVQIYNLGKAEQGFKEQDTQSQ